MILDLFPPGDRLEAVKKTNKDGNALPFDDHGALKTILESIPEENRLEVGDRLGKSVLHLGSPDHGALKPF